MYAGLHLLIVLGGLWIGAGILSLMLFDPKTGSKAGWWFVRNFGRTRKAAIYAATLVSIAAVILPFEVKFVSANHVLIRQESIVHTFPRSTVLWRSLYNRLAEGDGDLEYYGDGTFEQWRFLKIITNNGQMRRLRYIISVRWPSAPEDALLLHRAYGNIEYNPELERFYNHLDSLLNEFDEKCGLELRDLYDPESESQQQAFKQLVESALESELAKTGLHIIGAKFNIYT